MKLERELKENRKLLKEGVKLEFYLSDHTRVIINYSNDKLILHHMYFKFWKYTHIFDFNTRKYQYKYKGEKTKVISNLSLMFSVLLQCALENPRNLGLWKLENELRQNKN